MSVKTALGGLFANNANFTPTPDIPRSNVQDAVRYVGDIASGGTPSTDAPSGAEYFVAQSDAGLSNERVATDTATIKWNVATIGQFSANWEFLGLEALTDPGGDRGVFWDDSDGAFKFFSNGTGMGFVGTQFSITDPDLVAIVDEASFAAGDILYHNGTTLARLGAGTAGNFLKTQGAGSAPTWEHLPAGSGLGDLLSTNNLSDLTNYPTARTNLGLGTGDSPQFTAVNIGNAADTTLTRVSAGVAAIEGSNILLASGIGSVVQAYDAELAAIAGLASAADSAPYFTGSGAAALMTVTAAARTVLDDATVGAMLTTLGGQPLDAELTAIAGLTSAADSLPYFTGSGTAALATFTTFGRSLMDDADASAAQTTLGLVIGTNVQAYDADLTTWAGLTPSANAQSLVTAANYAAMRTLLDLEAGTDFYSIAAANAAFQPLDGELSALAGLTSAADAAPYFTGSGTAALMTVTAAARTVLDDASVGAMLTTLGGQPLDSELTAIAGLTSAADSAPYFTGSGTAALMTVTTAARTILDDASVGAIRTTLGVGTADNPQFATIELGAASDTTISRTAAGAIAVEGVAIKTAGKETVWVPSQAMVARTTNGAASGTVESSTNKNIYKTLNFDTTTQEFAQFFVKMPKSWNESTVTATFTWSHAATTVNFGVVWALEAVAFSDADAGDAAPGTAQQIADTGGTTSSVYVTGATPAITIAGSPAAEDWVLFQVKRVPADGSDTMAIDARLHGVTLYITTDAATDA